MKPNMLDISSILIWSQLPGLRLHHVTWSNITRSFTQHNIIFKLIYISICFPLILFFYFCYYCSSIIPSWFTTTSCDQIKCYRKLLKTKIWYSNQYLLVLVFAWEFFSYCSLSSNTVCQQNNKCLPSSPNLFKKVIIVKHLCLNFKLITFIVYKDM